MRRILGIIVVLIILASGLGYLAYANASFILARIISNKTHVGVKIQSVDFEEERIAVKGVWMGNPRGARLPTALTAKTVHVDAPYNTYLENPIVIEQIHLDDLYVNIQLYNEDQTEGNWQTIIKNVQRDNKSPLSIEREVHIKSLLITNIRIDLILSNGELYHLSPILKIEFHDLTTEKGVPIQEISEIIVKKMMQSIFIEKGLKGIIEAPIDVIKGIFPFFGKTQTKEAS